MNKTILWLTTAHTFFLFLFLLASTQVSAAEIIKLPGCAFKYSVETSAKKSTIWRLWSDVENWKKFDTLLEYSYLVNDASFTTGAVGYIKADGAFKTRFELTEVNAPNSFIESLKLPLYSSIELKRYFEINDSGNTTFTHEVDFKGPLKWLIYAVSAGTFKKELPLVVGRLKDVAEREERDGVGPFNNK